MFGEKNSYTEPHRENTEVHREERMEIERINKITGDIIACAIEVHKALGPGLLESAYKECLSYLLTMMSLRQILQRNIKETKRLQI